MQKSDVGKDGSLVQQRLLEFEQEKHSPRAATRLAAQVVKALDTSQWMLAVKQVEGVGSGIVRQKEFWRGLALERLMRFELSHRARDTIAMRRLLLAEVFRTPKSLFDSNLLCVWAMQSTGSWNSKNWDAIAMLHETSKWLDLAGIEKIEGISQGEKCQVQVAKTLLVASLRSPSQLRDSRVVKPWLDKRGFVSGADDWLGYAQRVEKRYGDANPEVQSIYLRLSREAGSDTIRKVAILWLEAHRP